MVKLINSSLYLPLENLEKIKRLGEWRQGHRQNQDKPILAPIMRTMQRGAQAPSPRSTMACFIDLLHTSLVNNYSSKYKGILWRKLLEASLCQATSSPSVTQSFKHDCKKTLRKKWPLEILRVNRTPFTCFLPPGCHAVILLCKVFFHVTHKRLSERGTTLSLFLSCTSTYIHIFY